MARGCADAIGAGSSFQILVSAVNVTGGIAIVLIGAGTAGIL